ncbi:uncharacterized protein AC631_00013 [Debaryomyces fabryi]|uniref:C2H2-type domain-containing protein n=1 Tax=Debaryomyces fabryi TaxID=58627 RepID=A0A0V1Q6J5_9ASCO|nr:uncharacterized protein AC631_00013 [Debaryomyces fabryi]KSA04142.1 hypothetical protein AC631_00013 [Debaryomyces fabryi]CUM46198.1 unnamed protein product [Debaryomyces fabryi]
MTTLPLHLINQNPWGLYNSDVSSEGIKSDFRIQREQGTNVSQTQLLTQKGQFSLDEVVSILNVCTPQSLDEYNEHLFKIISLIYENQIEPDQFKTLEKKLYELMDMLPTFVDKEDPIHSKLYIIVEKCFDIFIKISTSHKNVDLSTKTIRFLTNLIMNLNYWELYNLLTWKPSIYHFLSIIQFDLNECYAKFIKDYSNYKHKQTSSNENTKFKAKTKRPRSKKSISQDSGNSASPMSDDASISPYENVSGSSTPSSFLYVNQSTDADDHDKFVSESLAGLTPSEKKKIRVDSKLAAHRIIKKTSAAKPSNKSSNYDPDVVHECQLPSADEPDKLCLRRFSRKYELIRHQETVHSKKKKLFKCYVCVKQSPNIGPRIFTRHDTLAKHIRVNHKISGREAKAEVAYSKKHAEIVEEGDITVHVGRRKTKVDFELRAHMEKRKSSKDLSDMDDDMDDDMGDINDSPGAIDSAEDTFN